MTPGNSVDRIGLSIVGFDDAEFRHGLVPSMTAVCQNSKVLGSEAVLMLELPGPRRRSSTPRIRALLCCLEVYESASSPRSISRGRASRGRRRLSPTVPITPTQP